MLNLRTIVKNILESKRTIKEEVSGVLRDGKVFVQFHLASVIGSLKRSPDKYNNLVAYYMPSSSSTQQSLLLHIDGYNDMILDEAKRLYVILPKHFTNSIMDNAAAFNMMSLPQCRQPSSMNQERLWLMKIS